MMHFPNLVEMKLVKALAMTHLTDEMLVTMYQETGCQDAFNTLYNRYKKRIESISHKQAKVFNIDKNEFISRLNEEFWYCVQRFDAKRTGFRQYVEKMLNYRAIDILRNECRNLMDELKEDVTTSADNDYHTIEFVNDIMNAVKADEVTRVAVKRYIEGYIIYEIAKETGVHPTTVWRKMKKLADVI